MLAGAMDNRIYYLLNEPAGILDFLGSNILQFQRITCFFIKLLFLYKSLGKFSETQSVHLCFDVRKTKSH